MSDDAKDPKDEAADAPETGDVEKAEATTAESEAAKVSEAAKGDEPKAEEAKDEPEAEEAKDEPKAEEAKDEPKAEEAKDEPKAEEAKDETPAAETPAAETPVAAAAEADVLGMLVEFDSEESLKAGCARVRDAGYSKWDAHTPYPVHGLDQAMGVKATILPWLVFGGGLTGAMVGLGLQLYTNGIELPFSVSSTLGSVVDPFLPSGYPYVVSGKPVFSVQANIPVIFELTILLSAFGAFFGMWGLNLLPRFHHPVFFSERFKRATQDRFFISIEAGDPLFDRERTRRLATALGGTFVEELVQGQEG